MIRYIHLEIFNQDDSDYIIFNGFEVSDIYDIFIYKYNYNTTILSNKCYQYRLESKYRYSGLLYDKLRCLFGYDYRNHNEVDIVGRDGVGKYLRTYTYRFYTQTMNLNYIERFRVLYSDSLLKNLYFIQS